MFDWKQKLENYYFSMYFVLKEITAEAPFLIRWEHLTISLYES